MPRRCCVRRYRWTTRSRFWRSPISIAWSTDSCTFPALISRAGGSAGGRTPGVLALTPARAVPPAASSPSRRTSTVLRFFDGWIRKRGVLIEWPLTLSWMSTACTNSLAYASLAAHTVRQRKSSRAPSPGRRVPANPYTSLQHLARIEACHQSAEFLYPGVFFARRQRRTLGGAPRPGAGAARVKRADGGRRQRAPPL